MGHKFYVCRRTTHISATCPSVRPSVCRLRPSVRHICDPPVNGLRYRNAFCAEQYVSGFFRPNFVIVILWIHPERVC